MTTALGALSLLLTILAFWAELFEDDPAELHRSWRESIAAMAWSRRLELAAMTAVGVGLVAT